MMERIADSSDTRSLDVGSGPTKAERAVSVEFIASLFQNTNDLDSDTSVSGWNVKIPGLSLEQDSKSTENGIKHPQHSSKDEAEAHAMTLLARPSNKTLRENAYASFITLVNARLHAYARRWPALKALLQYRISPTTLLSRLEVLSPSSTASNEDKDDSIGKSKLAICCWSMAMDLKLQQSHDAIKEQCHDDRTRNSPKSSPVISISFSTLGSISQDTLQNQQLLVDLDLQVLLSEMIRQASSVVSAMANLASTNSLPPPPSPKQGVKRTSSCSCMPPPPPRRVTPRSVVVSPDISSSTANRVVPSLHLNGDDSSLSLDQCADIVDTCLTEFEPELKRAKLVATQP